MAVPAAPADPFAPPGPAAYNESYEAARLRAIQLALAARAPATLRAYRRAFADWTSWCAHFGVGPLNSDAHLVALYLAERASKLALSSLRGRLAAIVLAHRWRGVPLDSRDPHLTAVLAGLAREKGSAPTRTAAPVLKDHLRSALGALPSTPIGVRSHALLLIGFGGAMRRSEVVALDLSDLAVGPHGVAVRIRRAKTDQAAAGAVIGIRRAKDPQLCVVRALEAWLALRGTEPGALFTRITKSGRVTLDRLSDKAVVRTVKACLEPIGLDPTKYAGHSLRAGLATTADMQRAALQDIQRQTRHRSVDGVLPYIRDNAIWRDNVTELIFAD